MNAALPDFTGRAVLITGAAGDLGRAHAALFARLGASVVVNDTGVDMSGANPDPQKVEWVAASLRELGAQAVADTSDVGSFAGGAAAVQRTIDEFGRIDILINNAGILGTSPVDTVTEPELDAELRVHTVGTVATMRAAFRPAATTSCPADIKSGTARRPTTPVAPVTKMRMSTSSS